MTQIAKTREGNGSDKGFCVGDVIEGKEGDGFSWGTTLRLLILHVGKTDVCAVVVKRAHLIPDKARPEYEDHGRFTLTYRDWQRVGVVPELQALHEVLPSIIAKLKQE